MFSFLRAFLRTPHDRRHLHIPTFLSAEVIPLNVGRFEAIALIVGRRRDANMYLSSLATVQSVNFYYRDGISSTSMSSNKVTSTVRCIFEHTRIYLNTYENLWTLEVLKFVEILHLM